MPILRRRNSLSTSRLGRLSANRSRRSASNQRSPLSLEKLLDAGHELIPAPVRSVRSQSSLAPRLWKNRRTVAGHSVAGAPIRHGVFGDCLRETTTI